MNENGTNAVGDTGEVRRVLLTGGLGAIGRASVEALRKAGREVTVLDRAGHEDAVRACPALGAPGSEFFTVDVTQRDQVEAAIDAASPFDAVIGIAGIADTARFERIDPPTWQRHLDVNLTGNFHVAQCAVKRLLQEERVGQLVFVSSWIGERCWPEATAYSVSKAGLNMLVKCIALEHAKDGITANVFAPGVLNAGMANEEALSNEAYARRLKSAVPLGRLQTVEDAAAVLVFMTSASAAYMTGSVVTADGGCALVSGGGW